MTATGDQEPVAEDSSLLEDNTNMISQTQEGGKPVPGSIARKASISETAEETSGGWSAPSYMSWFEILFRMKDPNTGKYLPEATGWAMDSAARGPLNQIGSYVGSAILQMAKADAAKGVPFGLKPSSLLTLMSSAIGVVAALLMPVFGAVVDHTRHRKLVGVISALICILTTGMQIGISVAKNNWLYILILDAIQGFALLVHATAVFAYLPDLTMDHSILPAYTSHFYIRQFISQFTVGGLVILIGQVRGNDQSLEASVLTARDGTVIAFTYGCILFGYAWTFLFRKRPALSQVPKGSNLLTTGFKQVGKTTRKIWGRYRALKWFMISLLVSPEAGSGVVQSIAVTFFFNVIQLATLDIAKILLVFQCANVPGSMFSKFLCKRITPLSSYRLGLTNMGISVAISAAVLDGPDRRGACFGFSAFWGFTMGWTFPSQRVLFVTLIPKGQETEMMGLFFFVGQVLGWLPPLVFTIMNENKVNMRWGLALITFFCIFAVCLTLPMGSYEEAVTLAAVDSEEKLNSVLESASHRENYSGFPTKGEAQQQEVSAKEKENDVEQPTSTELEVTK